MNGPSLRTWLVFLWLVPATGWTAEPRELLDEAGRAAAAHQLSTAEKLATEALGLDSNLAPAYYLRGRARFQQGKIEESVKDFDRYAELRPEVASLQWERGIAYYYAGQFARGTAQFELYQTKHDNDVENSVWRFLCMVPAEGLEKARESLLPIRGDRRVPMMAVLEMYRGKLTAEDVLREAQAGSPRPALLTTRLFYAHLYIGLHYHAQGDSERAEHYLRLAADKKHRDHPGINRYMWEVARVHLKRPPATKTE